MACALVGFTAWSADPPPPRVRVYVSHHFDRATARERLCQLLTYWHDRFQVVSRWDGDVVDLRTTILGVRVEGTLEVTDDAIQGTALDPGLLWRAAGLNYVQRKLRKYLHPAYAEPD